MGVHTYECATGRVELMARWSQRGLLHTTNAVALALLAGTLALAAGTVPAAAATRIDLGSSHVADPSLGPGDLLAFDEIVGGTLRGALFKEGTVTALPGTHPDVDGNRVVVDVGAEFQILDLTTGALIRTVRATGSDPALSGRWLVYRRRLPDWGRIVLYDLQTSTSRVIASAKPAADLGAPDVSGLRVVYTLTTSRRSMVRIHRIDTGETRVLRQATRVSYAFAAVSGTVVAFVRQTLDGQQLVRVSLIDQSAAVLQSEPRGTRHFLWTVDVRNWRFVFTRYSDTGSAILEVGS
jgi:hypothetical protein